MEFFNLSPTVRIESPRKGNVPAPITIINRGLPAKTSSKTENCFGLGFFFMQRISSKKALCLRSYTANQWSEKATKYFLYYSDIFFFSLC